MMHLAMHIPPSCVHSKQQQISGLTWRATLCVFQCVMTIVRKKTEGSLCFHSWIDTFFIKIWKPVICEKLVAKHVFDNSMDKLVIQVLKGNDALRHS